MAYGDLYWQAKHTRHKIFISYYHREDQSYRDTFEKKFGHLFISKSVEPGDIDPDLSTQYIKRLIQEGYITDSSVVVVLVGPKTYCRKHVDWEISAGLSKKVGGYSGLLGILLPGFSLADDNKYYYDDLPARLADNVKSGYARIYTWDYLCASADRVRDTIETAFEEKDEKSHLIQNSRRQLQRNLCQ